MTTTTGGSATAPWMSSGRWSRPASWGRWRSTGSWRSAPAGPLTSFSAILLGLGALLGSLVLRALLRTAWKWLIGTSTAIVIGPPGAAGIIARRVTTHPETHLRLVGYLSPPAEGSPANGKLPRLGSVSDISRVAAEHGVERVIVTEEEMTSWPRSG